MMSKQEMIEDALADAREEIESLRAELAEKCERIDEADGYITSLEAIVSDQKKRIEELEDGRGVSTVPRKRRVIGEGHIITTEEIDKLWERGNRLKAGENTARSFIGEGILQALKELGIGACEDCYGSGRIPAPWNEESGETVKCPTCDGHGWRKK